MTPTECIDDLLSKWQKAADDGRELSVAELCRETPEHAGEVARRLLPLRRVRGLLAGENAAPATTAPTSSLQVNGPTGVGDRIGPYRLRELLGEGGMGVVYVAEQTAPVQRRVAVKLIKPDFVSKHLIARFEQERQALALMDHPNIAKVLDAGQSADAIPGSLPRPYFVMELVKGVPITRYCDEAKLTVRQRLELFVPVCQAIQHAHQKGIIHRDLKPSNIFVGLYDGKPVPKIIDFGVAKATGSRLTDKSLYTEVGAIIGTLEYMSPEQAELDNLDIDTRTDIYALGVILYELLTGATPFSRKALEASGMGEMLRHIREVEPAKPSTRLSADETLPNIAAKRQIEPRKLSGLMRGELDWIALKCLEKDRSRRYETANQVAQELQRYLADEPVLAGPPSAGYRMKKFARRHRREVIAAALIVGVLINGIVGTTIGLRRAIAERNEKEQARLDEAEQRHRAEEHKQKAVANEARAIRESLRAKEERAIAVAVRRFLQDDLLRRASPYEQAKTERGLGTVAAQQLSQATVRQLLDAAAEELVPQLAAVKFPQPSVRAEIMETVGEAYIAVGEIDRGFELLQRVYELRVQELGPRHSKSLCARNSVAFAQLYRGKYHEASDLFLEVLLIIDDMLKNSDKWDQPAPDGTAETPAQAIAAVLVALETRIEPNRPPLPSLSVGPLDMARLFPKLMHGIQVLQRVSKRARQHFGADSLGVLAIEQSIAFFQEAAHLQAQAIANYEAILQTVERVHPDWHDRLMGLRGNLARAYATHGRPDDAKTTWEAVLRDQEKRLGLDHPQTGVTLGQLAGLALKRNRPQEAIALLSRAYESHKTNVGPENPRTCAVLIRLADAYQADGQHDRAIQSYQLASEIQVRRLGKDHRATLTTENKLGVAYEKSSQFAAAIRTHEKVQEARLARFGRDDSDTLDSAFNLAIAMRRSGRQADAMALLEKTRDLERDNPKVEAAGKIATLIELAATYEAVGQFTDAIATFELALVQRKTLLSTDHQRVRELLANLVDACFKAERFTDAERYARELLLASQKANPDAWSTFKAHSMLGRAMLGQKRWAEAEPKLREGYDGLKKRSSKIPTALRTRHVTEAATALIALYDAWNKPEEAKQWRAELEAIRSAAPQGEGKP